MATNEQIISKIENYGIEEISLIFKELNKELSNQKEIEAIKSEIKEDKTELDNEKLEILKLLIIALIKDDEKFAKEIETIIINNRNNQPKDIDIVIQGISYHIDTLDFALLLITGLGGMLIKANFPNVVKTKEKEIRRGYGSGLFDAITEIVKTKKISENKDTE